MKTKSALIAVLIAIVTVSCSIGGYTIEIQVGATPTATQTVVIPTVAALPGCTYAVGIGYSSHMGEISHNETMYYGLTNGGIWIMVCHEGKLEYYRTSIEEVPETSLVSIGLNYCPPKEKDELLNVTHSLTEDKCQYGGLPTEIEAVMPDVTGYVPIPIGKSLPLLGIEGETIAEYTNENGMIVMKNHVTGKKEFLLLEDKWEFIHYIEYGSHRRVFYLVMNENILYIYEELMPVQQQT